MNYSNLELTIKTKYLNYKNCFLHLNKKYKEILNENDIVQLKTLNNQKSKAYFSIIFKNSDPKDVDCAFIDRLYGNKLGIHDDEEALMIKCNNEIKYARIITIQPLSNDDWQILELNIDNIQDNLLNQIKVVFKDQIFPIWIESNVSIFVKVYSHEPETTSFICLNQMTRVVVETASKQQRKEEKLVDSVDHLWKYFDCSQMKNQNYTFTSPKEYLNLMKNYTSESKWSFKAKIAIQKALNYHCSTLTTLNVTQSTLKNFGIEIDAKDQTKYLVKVEHIRSPMSKSNNKDLIKRLSQLVESSYPIDYIQNCINKNKQEAYALLNILPENDRDNNFLVEMSEFLMRQMDLCSFSQVKVTSLSIDELNNKQEKKKILLKTSHTNIGEVINAFYQLIEQNSQCLCPIVLTNLQIFQVKLKEIDIKFQIETNDTFITLNSNSLTSECFQIEVNSNECYTDIQINAFQKIKQFDLHTVSSNWFTSHISLVEDYLTNNFNSCQALSRSIMLQGAKGSGKTTLCKYVCNKYLQTSIPLFYQFLNCQNIMGKSIDSINDQLRLIYEEALWCRNSIVILDNIDLLMENFNSETDPISKLYCHQLIEILKEAFKRTWSTNESKVITLATSTSPISELPSIFHCLDNHGLFTSFINIRPSNKQETIEIIQVLLENKKFKFENALLSTLSEQTENCVFKDIEKLIEKIIFEKWSKNPNDESRLIKLNDVKSVIENYKSMNLLEANYFKAKNAISWHMIGGLESVKKALIESIIWPIKYEKLYKKLNMKQFSSVLLYGPSGCGKTLIASALANESKLNFISVKGPELLSKYIGTSEQNVRELFRKAERARPCVIFFDEFDSLAPKRGHDSTGVTDRVVNQLLTQLDGVEQFTGVYLVAASSRPDLIDSALLRPGRIDNYVYIGYPNEAELIELIHIYCSKVKLEKTVDLSMLVKDCTYFTGADIKSLICDALLKAFHRLYDKFELNEEDFSVEQFNFDKESRKDIVDKITITHEDLLTSIKTIKKTININERIRLNGM